MPAGSRTFEQRWRFLLNLKSAQSEYSMASLRPMPTEELAHEFANGLLQAVGWNGEIDRQMKIPLKNFMSMEKDDSSRNGSRECKSRTFRKVA